jgi:hypothetical protein
MFIIALFTITNLRNQPRYTSTDEWMKKMWYIYTMAYYSVVKMNEIMLLSGKCVGQRSSY